MLTRKQHELIRFIQTRLEESGVSPSFEEMKEALDLKSKSGIHRLITALEERGFIRRLPHRARALEVLRMLLRPLPVAEIAATLHLSEKTICNLHYQIKRKLGVTSDIELTRRMLPLLEQADASLNAMAEGGAGAA